MRRKATPKDLMEIALRNQALSEFCIEAREASLDFVALVDRLIILSDYQPDKLSIKGPFFCGGLDANTGYVTRKPGEFDIKYKLGVKQ
jgi:hypothetical protein